MYYSISDLVVCNLSIGYCSGLLVISRIHFRWKAPFFSVPATFQSPDSSRTTALCWSLHEYELLNYKQLINPPPHSNVTWIASSGSFTHVTPEASGFCEYFYVFLPVKQNPNEKQSENVSVDETNTHRNISGPNTRQNLYNVRVDNINGGGGEEM